MCLTGKDGPRRDQHFSGHSQRSEVLEGVNIRLHRLSHELFFVKGLSSLTSSIWLIDRTLTSPNTLE